MKVPRTNQFAHKKSIVFLTGKRNHPASYSTGTTPALDALAGLQEAAKNYLVGFWMMPIYVLSMQRESNHFNAL